MKNNILIHIVYLKKKNFNINFYLNNKCPLNTKHTYINVHFTEYRLQRVGVNYCWFPAYDLFLYKRAGKMLI